MGTVALLRADVSTESEKDFASWFEDWLRLRGWLWTHFETSWHRGRFRTALSGDPGFPDYVCVKGRSCCFVELKAKRTPRSRAQIRWHDALRGADQISYVFRPSDRDDIMRIFS
jgi:hypothetical protein